MEDWRALMAMTLAGEAAVNVALQYKGKKVRKRSDRSDEQEE